MISSSWDEEMSSWKEAMQANWCRKHYKWSWYFCNGSENFAILAKFLLWPHFCYDREISLYREIYCAWRNLNFRYAFNFRYIAKVTVHSENSNFRYAYNFRYIAKFTVLRNCCPSVFDPNDPVLCNSHFALNVIKLFWLFWYFHLL